MYRTTVFALLFCASTALVSCKETDPGQVNQYVEFRLFSNDLLDENYLTISPEDMGNFNYKSICNYVFLLHDEKDNSFDNTWYWRAINRFLKKENYVVIAAGYGKAFKDSSVDRDDMIIPLGQRIGQIAVALKKKSVSTENMEIVGHSIGAHIAGVASQYLKTNSGKTVWRLFALDPCIITTDHKGHLKKSDAEQVVVIHTSKQGIQDPIGDVDFYPDGGYNHTECGHLVPYDDHHMALYYFLCSIIKDCRMYGRTCDGIESYGAGKCSSNPTALMGYNVDFNCPKGSYYLYTFCREMQGKILNY